MISRTAAKNLIFIIPAVLAVFIVLSGPASGASLDEQRDMFRQARKELQAGRIESFNKLADQLQDYPLYPYLQFNYLSRYIWKVKDKQLIAFFDKYSELPIANDLRRTWLNYLAKRGRWQTFVDNYSTQSNELLQCYYLHARLKSGRRAYLLEDTRSIWLTGTSRPPQCDQAFTALYKSKLMNDDLLWQRIRLAMAEGSTSLAGYLGRKLQQHDRIWVSRWIAMHGNPWKWTANPGFEDVPPAREILAYGIRRLAWRDIDKAIDRWERFKADYSFNPEQIKKVSL